MPAVNGPGADRPQEPGGAGPADADLRARRAALHLPFRPLSTRRMARVAAVVEFVVVGAPALFVARTGPGAFGWTDRLSILALAALIAAGILRFSMLVAVPTEDGLVVRNLVHRTDLVWTQIVSVHFGGGNPWAMLDLDDGETLAVMAIQRADGARGEAEASRLATLVALHSRTARDS
jgi:hypothetical protein